MQNQFHKLLSSLCTLPKPPQHTASCRNRRSLLDASHNHTQVLTLHHDCNALWSEDFAESEGDLLGESFLDLEAACKHFCDAGEFGEAENFAIGDVTNVHFAEKGDKVVLTEGVDFNVADNDYREKISIGGSCDCGVESGDAYPFRRGLPGRWLHQRYL